MSTPITPERLAAIRGNIRIYDNRVAERDVRDLLAEVARLIKIVGESCVSSEDFAAELRKWWTFDNHQQHTHSFHTREFFIAKRLSELLGQKSR